VDKIRFIILQNRMIVVEADELYIMIALMMEAARTSETSVDSYFTRQYIREDKSELQYTYIYIYIYI
jgi:hypothetical protein